MDVHGSYVHLVCEKDMFFCSVGGMMRPLFALTREDHRIEQSLLGDGIGKRLLCICSGGCTPLSIKASLPKTHVTAFDMSAVQLEYVQKKQQAIAQGAVHHVQKWNKEGFFEGLF